MGGVQTKEVFLNKQASQVEHLEDTQTIKSSMQACKDMPGHLNMIIS